MKSVECSEIILRALLKPGWLHDEGRIKADAFLWRSGRDSDGLSVNLKTRTDVPAWLSGFKRSVGADSLHTGRVRDLNPALDVQQTESEFQENSAHAVISGMPDAEVDPLSAETLAGKLARMSRPLDRIDRKMR